VRRRAFSLVELAVVLAVMAVLSPIVYAAIRGWEEQRDLAAWHLRSAGELADIAEELRIDARLGYPLPGAVGFQRAACSVTYLVRGRTLVREGCGRSTGLARDVARATWAPGGVEVELVRRLRPDAEVRVVTLVPVETP
jgi:prepilin-type N-terminal cleavage/methylation domain-containing protein